MSDLATEVSALFERAIAAGDVRAASAVAFDRAGICYAGAHGHPWGDVRGAELDSVAAIMSMTKAITGVAAIQLVEAGKLDLHAPAGDVCPYLGQVQVLTGFDAAGNPQLRAPKRPITLSDLLTHTSGLVYDVWNEDLVRYIQQTGTPSLFSLQLDALKLPLAFDPGERWEYGIGIDWAGQMVEAVSGQSLGAYSQAHIFEPLGMTDTAFTPTASMAERLMPTWHRVGADLVLPPPTPEDPNAPAPEFEMGGGGLLSTVTDYARFLQMLLGGGELDGQRVLQAATVATMVSNQIGDVRVGRLPSVVPELSNDAEFFPGEPKGHGYTFQINLQDADTGRKAGTLMWAGLTNCYYWVDPTSGVGGVFITQVLPFADERCLNLFFDFERAVYRSLG